MNWLSTLISLFAAMFVLYFQSQSIPSCLIWPERKQRQVHSISAGPHPNVADDDDSADYDDDDDNTDDV